MTLASHALEEVTCDPQTNKWSNEGQGYAKERTLLSFRVFSYRNESLSFTYIHVHIEKLSHSETTRKFARF